MGGTKVGEGFLKKRAKSQRLKKSFDTLLKPQPKSERKNSVKAKLSHSFNYIKIRKDKTSQNNEQSTKVKPKLQKAKPKVLKEHTLSVTHDDFKDSVSQNVRGSTLKKSKNASKEVDTHRIIHEQELEIQHMNEEIAFLREQLNIMQLEKSSTFNNREESKQEMMEEQISEIKNHKQKGMFKANYKQQEMQQEMEAMIKYIEDLKTELLAEKLQSEEYASAVKKLISAQKKGVQTSILVMKDIFQKKIRTALNRCFLHIGQIDTYNKQGNIEEVQKLLLDLPRKIERSLNLELIQ